MKNPPPINDNPPSIHREQIPGIFTHPTNPNPNINGGEVIVFPPFGSENNKSPAGTTHLSGNGPNGFS